MWLFHCVDMKLYLLAREYIRGIHPLMYFAETTFHQLPTPQIGTRFGEMYANLANNYILNNTKTCED